MIYIYGNSRHLMPLNTYYFIQLTTGFPYFPKKMSIAKLCHCTNFTWMIGDDVDGSYVKLPNPDGPSLNVR